MQLNPGERNGDAHKVDHHAHRHNLQRAKFFDQVACEKARRKHGNHMPLQHQRCVIKTEAAHLHGQRGGGHKQVHHAIAQGRSGRRHNEDWLAHDLSQRAPRAVTGLFGGHFRESDEGHAHHGQNRHDAQRHVSAQKWHFVQSAGARGQVGAHDGPDQTSSQNQRNRFFLEAIRCQLGRGKSVQLAVGAVVTRNDRGRHQQPEVMAPGGISSQQCREKSHAQPQLKRHLAPPARLALGHQPGRQRPTHHIAHDGQSRHPAQRGHGQTH